MDGQGPSPVQEQAVNRSLVFTGPQTNINRLNFLTLNGSVKASDTWSLQALVLLPSISAGGLQWQHHRLHLLHGSGEAGELCQSDGLTPVTNSKGAVLPDISDGGSLVIGENDFETINAYGRGAALQSADNASIAGDTNVFIVGATLDYAAAELLFGQRR
jgi:iron complex outermembrane receptor protein